MPVSMIEKAPLPAPFPSGPAFLGSPLIPRLIPEIQRRGEIPHFLVGPGQPSLIGRFLHFVERQRFREHSALVKGVAGFVEFSEANVDGRRLLGLPG